MTPAYFWRCSPRKFNALCLIHAKLNSTDDKTKNKTRGAKGEKNKPVKRPIAQKPETFIDKIL